MSNDIPLAQAAKLIHVTKQALDYHRKKGHITTRQAGRIHLVDPDVLRKELEPYMYKKDKLQKTNAPELNAPENTSESSSENNAVQ